MKKSKDIIVLKYILSWKSGRNHTFLSWKKGNTFFKYQFYLQILPIPAKNTIFAHNIGTKTCR